MIEDFEKENITTTFLKANEIKDITRQLDLLKIQISNKDEEIAKLKILSDKGQLLKDNQKMNNFIADLRNENLKLKQELGDLPNYIVRLNEYESTFDTLKTECALKVTNADRSVQELKIKYDEQHDLISRMEEHLEQKELKLQTNLHELSLVNTKNSEYLQTVEDLRREVQRLRDGTHLEMIEERMSLLQTNIDTKTAEFQTLQTHYFAMSAQNEELLKANELHKKSIGTQIDKAVAGIQSELNDLKIRNSQLLAESRENKEQKKRLEARLEESQTEMFSLQNQLTQYEHGLGVRDTMERLRKLKLDVEERDRQILQFNNEINEKDRHIFTLTEDWRRMRKSLGLNDTLNSQDVAMSSYHKNIEKLQSEVNFCNGRLEVMETDRRKLLEDLRKQMLITNETGFKFYGLTADQMTLVVTYAESLRDGTNIMPLNDHSRKLNNDLEEAKVSLSALKVKLEQASLEKNNAFEQLRVQKDSSDKQYREILIQINEMKNNQTRPQNTIDPSMLMQLKEILSNSMPLSANSTGNYNVAYNSNPSFEQTQLSRQDANKKPDYVVDDKLYDPSVFEKKETTFERRDDRRESSFEKRDDRRESTFERTESSRKDINKPVYSEYKPKDTVSKQYDRDLSFTGNSSLKEVSHNFDANYTYSGNDESVPNAFKDPPEVFQKRLFGCLHQLLLAEKDSDLAYDALQAQNAHSTQMAALIETLYSEYITYKKGMDSSNAELKSKVTELETQHEKDVSALRVVSQSLRIMSEGSLEDQLTRISLLSDQAVTMETDRKVLTRRIKALNEELRIMQEAYTRKDRDLFDCDRITQGRAAQLTTIIHSAQGRVAAMMEVEKWVSREDFTKLLTAHESLSVRYRELMLEHEASQNLIANSHDWKKEAIRLQQTLDDVEARYEEASTLSKKFELLSLLPTGEAAESSNKTRSQSLLEISPSLPSLTDVTILQARIASLQVTEQTLISKNNRVNERFETLRLQFEQSEEASKKLEVELRKAQDSFIRERDENLENKRIIENAVSFDKYSSLQSKLSHSETNLSDSKARLEQQRLLADVATRQIKDLNEKTIVNDNEIILLRAAITDFEQRTDDNLIIGRLEREAIQLKLDNKQKERDIENLKDKVERSESQIIRLEMRIEEENARLFRYQSEARRTLAQYRLDASNSKLIASNHLSISQAEEIREVNNQLMRRLDSNREEKQRLLTELYRCKLELSTIALNGEIRTEFETLFGPDITDHRLKQKVLEAKKEIRSCRITELENSHKLSVLQSEIDFLKESIGSHVSTIKRLNSKLLEKEDTVERDDEDGHEQFLARKRKDSIITQDFSVSSGKRFGMPVDQKVASTQTTISPGLTQSLLEENSGSNLAQSEIRSLHTELQLATDQIKTKEKIISDLRTLLQQQLTQTKTAAMSGSTAVELVQSVNASERQHLLDAAKGQIKSFQLLVDQKNKAIESYKKLIAENSEIFAKEKARDQAELLRMNELLHRKGDEKLNRMKSTMDNLSLMPNFASADELSDQLDLKDRQITMLTLDFEKAERSAIDAEQKVQANMKEIDRLKDQVKDLEAKLKASPGMSTIRSLKQQLAEKEDRLAGLQNAITQLKTEMIELSQTAVVDDKSKVDKLSSSSLNDKVQIEKLEKKLKHFQQLNSQSVEKADAIELQSEKLHLNLKNTQVLCDKYKLEAVKMEKQYASAVAKAQKSEARIAQLEKEKADHVCSQGPTTIVQQPVVSDNKYELQLNSLKKRSDDFQALLQETVKERDSLLSKLKSYEAEVQALRIRLDEKTSSYEDINDASRLMEVREALASSENKVRELLKKLALLEKKESNISNNLSDFEKVELESEFFELKLDHSFCEERLKRNEELYLESQKLIQKQSAALKSLTENSVIDNKDSKSMQKRSEVSNLAKENPAELVKLFDMLKSTADKLQSENMALTNERNILKKEIDSLKTSNIKYMDAINLNKKLKQKELTLEEKIKAQEIKLASFEKDLPRITNAYENALISLKKSETEVKRLQLKAQNASVDMADLRLKLTTAEQAYEQASKSLSNDRLRSSKESSDITNLTSELNSKRNEIDKLTSELKNLRSNASDIDRSTFEQLKAENEALRNELSAFDEKFFEEIMELKYSHESLKKAYSELLEKSHT